MDLPIIIRLSEEGEQASSKKIKVNTIFWVAATEETSDIIETLPLHVNNKFCKH